MENKVDVCAEREAYIKKNMGLVYQAAKRFQGRGVEMEDLIQTGCIGLVKAVDRYDSSLGYCFSTYAVPVIIGEMRRMLRDQSKLHISRSLKEKYMKIVNKREEWNKTCGKEPSVQELAREVEMTVEEVIACEEAFLSVRSLEEGMYGEEGEEITLMEGIRSQENMEEQVVDAMAVKEMFQCLSTKEQQVIQLTFFQGKKQCEIAKCLSLSQAQVSRVLKTALIRLRSQFAI